MTDALAPRFVRDRRALMRIGFVDVSAAALRAGNCPRRGYQDARARLRSRLELERIHLLAHRLDGFRERQEAVVREHALRRLIRRAGLDHMMLLHRRRQRLRCHWECWGRNLLLDDDRGRDVDRWHVHHDLRGRSRCYHWCDDCRTDVLL